MNLLRSKPRDTALAPGTMLTRVRDDMERALQHFFREPWEPAWLRENGNRWMPMLDVKDTEAEVIVKAEIPGVDAKNVDISLSGNVLTISGQKEELKEEKGEDYFVSERNFGSFRRSLELPQTVDPEKITAEQENGVLTVKIGKLKTAKPKHIPVKAAVKAGV